MADDYTIPGVGVAAVDVIAGVGYQRTKAVWGDDGTANDTSATNPLPVRTQGATATLANVSGSASSVTLIASNTDRRGAVIYNDSASVLYVKFGSTASSTSFTYYVAAYGTLELPAATYTGIITGIWVSATGSARCTEITS